MKLENIKKIAKTLDSFKVKASFITIYNKKQAITNFVCGEDLQKQSDLIFNMILQSQFEKGYSVDKIISAINAIYYRTAKFPKEVLADFDYDKLFSRFNHMGTPMKLHELNEAEANLLNFDQKLKLLKQSSQIRDYLLFVNYDNHVMFYRSSFDNVAEVTEYANLVLNFCRTFSLDTIEYLDAMKRKAKMLRAHLILGTIDPTSNERSLLFKLSSVGKYDFNRSLLEFKLEQQVTSISKDIRNSDYDWHTLFVATENTNYLSITYSDFKKTVDGLKSLNNAIYDKFPNELDTFAAFYDDFFDSIKSNLNEFFYPSKKWGAFEDSIQLSQRNNGAAKSLPIDKLVKSKTFHNVFKCVFAEASMPPARLVKVITNEEVLFPLCFVQFLGTLMSVYPEQVDILSNWGTITKEQFKEKDN